MKQALALAIIFIMFAAMGCATSTATGGRDFNSAKVQEIQKGQTTANELVEKLGQPWSKKAKSETEEEWTYEYTVATAKARAGLFGSMDVETTGTMKNLTVLIRNGKVVNFTYNEGPIHNEQHTQSYK